MKRHPLHCAAVVSCLLLALLGVPSGAWGEAVTLIPMVDLTGAYDDNVLYTSTQEKSDYVGTLRPGFILDYDSELFRVRSRGSMDILRYLDDHSLNRENYYAYFDGGVNLTERWNLRGNFSFINDTTLDSQLEETGIVTLRTDRKRYDGGGELSYWVTERSNAGLSYMHQSTRYGSERYENYDSDSIRLRYDYRLNNGLDTFTVLPNYTYWRSDISNVNNYGLSFGLSHIFTETFSLDVFLGARYTQTQQTYTRPTWVYDPGTGTFRLINQKLKLEDDNWGATGNIQVKKDWTRSSLIAGYSHDLTYSSSAGLDAEPVNVDRFYFTATHKIVSRLRAAFTGSYYMSKSASDFGNQDNQYITLTPGLDYDLTENYALRLGYTYSREFNRDSRDNADAERSRVWVTFTGKMPMKW